jgi:WD40 repeat protein
MGRAYTPIGGLSAPRILPGYSKQNLVESIIFSPDSSYAVAVFNDGTILVWDAQTAQQVASPLKFKGHNDLVKLATFPTDGRYIVSGSYDNAIRIWNT